MSKVVLTRSEYVATIKLNRPDALNALSPAVLESIVAHCEELADDDNLRVVVLRGAGRGFSAGADVQTFVTKLQSDDSASLADLGRRATEALGGLPQPTVAAIHGPCVGGGLVLAAACDVRIAAASTTFSVPELELGIPLAWGGMAHLVRLVGETLAADLVLTCRRFGANEAQAAGLLTRVVPDADFDPEIEAFVELVQSRPAGVLRTTKQQLTRLREGTFDAAEDASALLAALQDPKTLAAVQTYIATKLSDQ